MAEEINPEPSFRTNESEPTEKVDEALRAVAEDANQRLTPSEREQFDALKAEIARLSESVANIAEGSVELAKASANDRVERVRDRIRAEPLRSAGIAVLIGYLWARLR